MITGIAHTCYITADLERAVEFYCGKLGLAHAFDFVNDQGKRHGVYIKAGRRTFIELFEGKPSAGESAYRHLCLEVDDMQKTVEQLRARGVSVGETTLGKDQSHQAWLADPDGNKIELHCYTDKSWQKKWL